MKLAEQFASEICAKKEGKIGFMAMLDALLHFPLELVSIHCRYPDIFLYYIYYAAMLESRMYVGRVKKDVWVGSLEIKVFVEILQ